MQRDKRQVEEYAPLLSALASGNQPAVEAAVKSLVYSHTHVVRLRVTQGWRRCSPTSAGPTSSRPSAASCDFTADAVGRYELSVQDDLGYVKLETRFIGAPLVLRIGSREVPVEGRSRPRPRASPSTGRSLPAVSTYRGVLVRSRAPSRAARCGSRCWFRSQRDRRGRAAPRSRSASWDWSRSGYHSSSRSRRRRLLGIRPLARDRSPAGCSTSAPAPASSPAARRRGPHGCPIEDRSSTAGSATRCPRSWRPPPWAGSDLPMLVSHVAPQPPPTSTYSVLHRRAAPGTAARRRPRPAWAGRRR